MRWPGSARCAVCISWDVDAGSLVLHRLPERGYELYAALSWLRYDEVAVPAIVETLDRDGIKQTFCVSGWGLDRYPAMCEPIVASGHEIAHHGYVHATPNELTAERELEELQELQRGIDAIERFSGRRPSGWRDPYAALSRHSADFLVQEGFLYDSSLMCDSGPCVIRARGGELIELPIETTMSDWPHCAHVPNLSYLIPPKSRLQRWRCSAPSSTPPMSSAVFWVSIWHSHVSGRPARLLAWTGLLEYMLEKGDVWFASLNEIARHVRSCVDSGTYELRVVSLPYYHEPPPEFAERGGPQAPRLSMSEEVR